MGEFSLSGNTNIGLSAVEIGVTSGKSNSSQIFYTTPTSSSDKAALQGQSHTTMQDELVDKATVSGTNNDDVISAVNDKSQETDSNSNATSDLTDKLNEQVAHGTKTSSGLPLFHPSEPSTPSGALWSTAIEDGFVPNITNVNGGLGFQNFPSPTQSQLFNNSVGQNQGRRAITASHNFPHNMGRQQPSHPLYKAGYGSWANPGQNWSAGSSVWNRGRSVPNLTPLQQMGVAGRKPSPTFNHQQVISPVKFRRSTSYPGKGPFPQPPTFEITNMDEARELLPYQDRCGVVSANGSSPLETMRGLEHYLNDIMRPPDTGDVKGQ
ncbi:hypothetical protein FQR65_LT10151 [Abscondita terminalis]|nr:hypothetical protein FQR65_LT10151 [Abscondita terminalis]